MVEESHAPRSSWREFLGPRDWLNWVGFAVVRALALLPLPVIWLAGSALGELLCLSLPRRRRIAATNLRACFPELSSSALARLTRANFRAFARTVLLTPVIWWGSPRRLARTVRHRHREHYDQALAAGRSVILLAPHFTGLEAGGVSRSG
jgi:KDO2-lipid IV(A) lauroyltransferase